MRLLIAAAIASVVVLCAPDYWELWTRRWDMDEFGNDFHLFYAASYMVAHGDYRCFQPQIMNQYCLLVTQGKYHAWPLYQTPFFILAFIPLAIANYFTATYIFLALNHLLLLASVLLLARALDFKPQTAAVWFLMSLLFVPVHDTLMRGQLNLIVLFFLSAFVYAIHANKDVAAGIALALAILTKIMPVLLLPVLLLHKRTKAALSTVACLAACWLIALLVLPELNRGWWNSIHEYSSTAPWMGLSFPASQSWFSVLARWFFPNAGTPGGAPLIANNPALGTSLIFAVAIALWAGVAAALWWHRHRPIEDHIGIVIAAIGCGVPYNWYHHHVWLLIPIMLQWRRGPNLALMLAAWSLFVADAPPFHGLPMVRWIRYYFLLWGGGAVASTVLVANGIWREK